MTFFKTPYTTLIRPALRNFYGLCFSYSLYGFLGVPLSWPLLFTLLGSMAFYHLTYNFLFKRIIEISDLSTYAMPRTYTLTLVWLLPLTGVLDFTPLGAAFDAAFMLYPIWFTASAITLFPILYSATGSLINFLVNSLRPRNYVAPTADAIRAQRDPAQLFTLAKQAILHDDYVSFNAILERLQRLNRRHLVQEDNGLLKFAAKYDRIDMVERLLRYNNIKQTAHANNNEALREALIEGNDDIALRLLDLPIVQEHIQGNDCELYRLGTRLNRWAVRDKVFTLMNPDFQAGLNPDPHFTLRNFDYYPRNPRYNVHKDLFPLRLRRRDFEFGNNQHVPLQQFARWGVHADFDGNQINAIQTMRQRYAEPLRARGRDNIMAEIRQALVAEYQAHPAQQNDEALPLEYDRNVDQRPYYQHPVHGAYRYLFARPNPWIHPDAEFVRQVGNGLAANTDEQDLDDIATMWLVATDENVPLPEGFTREALKIEFYNAVSDLSRAHNRDNGNDDLGRDRPTCNQGVTLRMMQYYMVFLNENAENRPLSTDVLFTKFKQEMINESEQPGCLYNKLRQKDNATLRAMKEALDNLCIINLGEYNALSAQERRLLNQIKFSKHEINRFVDHCKTHYGQARISQNRAEQIRYHEHRFDTYADLIKHFGKIATTQFYEDISRHLDQLIQAEHQADPVLFQAPGQARNRETPVRHRTRAIQRRMRVH